MGKSCSKIILLILILAAWIVVTVRAKKTEEGIILTDAYKSGKLCIITYLSDVYPFIGSRYRVLSDCKSIVDFAWKI